VRDKRNFPFFAFCSRNKNRNLRFSHTIRDKRVSIAFSFFDVFFVVFARVTGAGCNGRALVTSPRILFCVSGRYICKKKKVMACECKPGHARVAFELISVVPGAALKLMPASVSNCDGSDRGPGTYVASTSNKILESQNFANYYDAFLKTLDATAEACYIETDSFEFVELLLGPNAIALLGGCGAPWQICTSDAESPPGPLAYIDYIIPFIECCPAEVPCCFEQNRMPDWLPAVARQFGITL